MLRILARGEADIAAGKRRFFYKLAGDVTWVVGVQHDAQIPDSPDEKTVFA